MLRYHHLSRRGFWILVCLLMVLVSAPDPQQPLSSVEAATFTVNSLANADDGTCDLANCTLREAVGAANAAGGADMINFSVSGTITFNTPLVVTDDLTIISSGITLNGNNATPLMSVASSTSVTLNGLSFENGFSTFGGAIESNGTLTIINSTFSGNRATSGGAIFNHVSTLTITNSTFSGNQATSGSGGAIFNNFPSAANITSSTFSGNTATADGGTIYNDLGSTTNVTSSIIVGGDCAGDPITDGGNNLSFNATSCPGTAADPQLGPLQNTGGSTATMLPATDGPAVDAYAPACATATDQRGTSRPQGSLCDIGATEQVGTTPLTASVTCNHPNLEVTITSGDGPFNITATEGDGMPVFGVSTGTTVVNGPERWRNVTVTETGGDLQSILLDDKIVCRSTEVTDLIWPPHRYHTTNTSTFFDWTDTTDANLYRVFIFDDKVAANRTVDRRQNNSISQAIANPPLPTMRLFWRARARVNSAWGFWSIRRTVFIDPPAITQFEPSSQNIQVPPGPVFNPPDVPNSRVETTPDENPTPLPPPPNSR